MPTLNTAPTFYSRNQVMTAQLIFNLVSNNPYLKFFDQENLPLKSGTKTVAWRNIPELSVESVPTALSEGVTPPAETLSKSDITSTIYQYGRTVVLTDELLNTSEFDMMKIAVKRLEQKASNEIGHILRNELNNATQLRRADGVAADVNIDTAIEAVDLDFISTALDEANVGRITKMVNPATGVSTTPLNSCFVGLVPKASKKDLWGISGFTRVENYSGDWKAVDANEIGTYADIRFIGTNMFTSEANAGGAVGVTGLRSTGGVNVDVFTGYIFGAGGLGCTTLTSKGLDVIEKEMKQGKATFLEHGIRGFKVDSMLPTMSDSDPLKQRAWASYKFDMAAKILKNECLYKFKFGISV